MTRHILLTGASGFVGRALVEAFAQHDVSITIVGRHALPEFADYDTIRKVITVDSLFTLSVDAWRDWLSDVDCVLHAAWYVDPKDYLHAAENLQCLQGSLNLVQACRAANVAAFCGIGTCFEYDHAEPALRVSTPLKPQSVYAASKSALCSVAQQLLKETSTAFSWYRLFYLYGKHEKPGRFVSYLRDQFQRGQPAVVNNPTLQRDYMDVADAADKIVASVLRGGQGVFNVCSEQPISLGALAKRIAAEHHAEHLLTLTTPLGGAPSVPVLYGISNLETDRHD